MSQKHWRRTRITIKKYLFLRILCNIFMVIKTTIFMIQFNETILSWSELHFSEGLDLNVLSWRRLFSCHQKSCYELSWKQVECKLNAAWLQSRESENRLKWHWIKWRHRKTLEAIYEQEKSRKFCKIKIFAAIKIWLLFIASKNNTKDKKSSP